MKRYLTMPLSKAALPTVATVKAALPTAAAVNH